MIKTFFWHSFILCFVIMDGPQVFAEKAQPSAPDINSNESSKKDDTPPFPSLLARAAGMTSRASVYDWRKQTLFVSYSLGQSVQMNNFEQYEHGLRIRVPSEDLLFSLSLKKSYVEETEGSKIMASTPYLQTGHPPHVGLGGGVDLPLSEGVGSQHFSWMPRSQIMFSFVSEAELMFYDGQGYRGGFKEKAMSYLSPTLSDADLIEVSKNAPRGMRVDTSRLSVCVGFHVDLFIKSGLTAGYRGLWHFAAGKTSMAPWTSVRLELGYGL